MLSRTNIQLFIHLHFKSIFSLSFIVFTSLLLSMLFIISLRVYYTAKIDFVSFFPCFQKKKIKTDSF